VTAQRPELQRARQWSTALATALDEVTEQVGAAARRIADGWPDAHGRDWTERLLQLRRVLDRDAADAHDLGRAIDRVAEVADGNPLPVGPQLGGTAGRHVDDRRGVTIPQLGDPFSG
jgi:hypothetical protein